MSQELKVKDSLIFHLGSGHLKNNLTAINKFIEIL